MRILIFHMRRLSETDFTILTSPVALDLFFKKPRQEITIILMSPLSNYFSSTVKDKAGGQSVEISCSLKFHRRSVGGT